MLFLIWFFGIQALVVIAFYYLTLFHGLADAKHRAENAWRAVELVMNRREDEIRPLMELARPALGLDKAIFEQISVAKKNLLNAAGPAAIGAADSQLRTGLKQLYAQADSNSNLKTHATFLQHRQQIIKLDAKIAEMALRYNQSAAAYNLKRTRFPERFIGWIQGLKPKESCTAFSR